MRSILLSTDGSQHSLRAARYVAELYRDVPDLHATILTISPAIPPIYREEGHVPSIRRQFTKWKKKREEEARGYTDEAAKILLARGFKKSHLKVRYSQQTVGVARDIIRVVDAGKYDACVVGKKGMGWFDSVFLGSITDKLLEISEDHPVWLVEGKVKGPRKVLIAMDETLHAVDLARYAGTMLKGVEGVAFDFYHYCTPFTEGLSAQERKRLRELESLALNREREEMTHFFDYAKKALLDMGFSEKSIRYDFQIDQSARPKKVTEAILTHLKKGGYGTLLIGRKGATHAREFRIGSIAMRTIAEAKDCAVWVV